MNNSEVDRYGNYSSNYSSVTFTWTWTTYCQLTMAIIGIVGNGLVIAVYKRRQATSATNELLVALAIADAITSVLMIPLPTLINVPSDWRGQLYCKIVISAIFMWISITVSVFTLTVVSIERYVAISYPSKYPLVFSKQSRSKIVIIIWLIAIALNVYGFVIWISKDSKCELIWPTPWMPTAVGVTLFLLKYLFPVLIMLLTQTATTFKIRSQRRDLLKRGVPTNSPAFSSLEVKSKVVDMLRVVVLMFVICWTTDQIGHLGFTIGFVPLR